MNLGLPSSVSGCQGSAVLPAATVSRERRKEVCYARRFSLSTESQNLDNFVFSIDRTPFRGLLSTSEKSNLFIILEPLQSARGNFQFLGFFSAARGHPSGNQRLMLPFPSAFGRAVPRYIRRAAPGGAALTSCLCANLSARRGPRPRCCADRDRTPGRRAPCAGTSAWWARSPPRWPGRCG